MSAPATTTAPPVYDTFNGAEVHDAEKAQPAYHHNGENVNGREMQSGTKKVEALQSVWSPKLKIMLFVGIAFASYMYILDNGTNWQWGSLASTKFLALNEWLSIGAVTSTLLAVGKPLFAKLTDALGRAEAISIALFFYVLGYIVCATSQGIVALGAGQCLWMLGFSGLQIALAIVIADVTTLKWRGLVSGLSTGGWYFLNFWANGKITVSLTNWRWGYGAYAIAYIPALLPIILTLFYAQRVAKRRGVIMGETVQGRTFGEKAKRFIMEVDVVGLFLLVAFLVLLFVPLVVSKVQMPWSSPAVPAMMCIAGFFVLPLLIFWEIKFATFPIVPKRFLLNRTVMCAIVINFFDFVSFYLTYAPLFGFVSATTNWAIDDITYYTNAQSLSLTFFGLIWSGVIVVFKTGYKKALIFALCLRLIGIALMFHARNGRGNVAELVITQIVQGAGGGIAAVATGVSSQGAVPHADLAIATAVVLLAAELGGVVGNAAAAAMNMAYLPKYVAEEFPTFNATEIITYTGSPFLVRMLPEEAQDKMHRAFSRNMRMLNIPAVVLAVIPIIAAFFTKDFQLRDVHNIAEEVTPEGKAVDEQSSIHKEPRV